MERTSELISRRDALGVIARGGLAITGIAALLGNVPEVQAAPEASLPKGCLKYDETGGTKLAEGQGKLVAPYLREVYTNGGTQEALETAIRQIQQEAATASADRLEGSEIQLPQGKSWLVWHSNGGQVTRTATDASFVFGRGNIDAVGEVYIVGPFAPEVPERSLRTFACKEGSFWAVAVC